ncbi:MAG TPA: BlaI/MecI/CopY family transcriptional regulator [Rhizomicrobium sp.]|jgi:predicted transcriptional regulator|nr:BlaI/MecI/CopY family transcriptional regulator [Rhizomicrobium sp.]
MKARKPRRTRKETPDRFSRREREIMDALYALGEASAAQILERIPDPPSYTAIRTQLTILEKKGHVRHRSDGARYIYSPRVAREQMGRRAIDALLETFYGNSVERVVAALLDKEDIGSDELDRLAELIEKAREEGR